MTHAFPTRRSSDLISPIAASAGSEPMDDHSYDAGEMLDCVTDTVREHPIPVALAGLGLGWLLYAGLRRNGDAGLAQSEYPDYVDPRSEEHTSKLQSLMRTSYAVFCLKITKH